MTPCSFTLIKLAIISGFGRPLEWENFPVLNSCITYFEVCDQGIVLVSLLKTPIGQDYSTVKITALKAIFRLTCYHIIHNKYKKILPELSIISSETFWKKNIPYMILLWTSSLKQDNFNRFFFKCNIGILNT